MSLQERARRSTAAAKNDPFTLLVVLDSKGQASGDLYLDDGSSFAYKRGVFAHRLFTFENGVLSSQELPRSSSASRFTSDVVIERIIVVGLGEPVAKFSVKEVGSGRVLQAGAGPVVQEAGVPELVLVVRKPELPIVGDWSVQFSITA